MSKGVKNTVIIALFSVLAITVLSVSALCYFAYGAQGDIYETNSVADYGSIIGNYDNETPKKFISSFFPKKIEPYFSQAQYHYKAIKGDSYAYEVLLEFVIEDSQAFDAYVQEISNGKKGIPFAYDQAYIDYTISDYYYGSFTTKKDEIAPAGIGKILVNKSEQRIVYVATGIYDGGYATQDDLNFFRNRFPEQIQQGQGDGLREPY